MKSSPAIACVLVAIALAPASPAWAFCRTTTAKVEECVWDESGCCITGKPLYWSSSCIGYNIQEDASRQISYDSARLIVSRAFTAWTGVTCPGGVDGASRVSIDVRDLGPVRCGVVEYNKFGPNQHTIVFRDEIWERGDEDNLLGLTTVSFDGETGRITNGDMEINTSAARKLWDREDDPIPQGYDDFLSVATHEAGHFLGIAHSSDKGATMFARYDAGKQSMRNLKLDDINAVCSIYLPDGHRVAAGGEKVPATACDPTPSGGLTTECKPAKGCSMASAPEGAPARDRGWAFVAAGIAASLVARRRRLRAG